MSAQKDCEFLVKRARELVSEDPCAAKAWLITARTLYPADFTIQVSLREAAPKIQIHVGHYLKIVSYCSMKCTSLNAIQRGRLLQGGCCTTCEFYCLGGTGVMDTICLNCIFSFL